MLKLSEHQSRIGQLVAMGYSNREIAAELKMSEPAVKSALHVLFDKIGCWNRVELANHFSRTVKEPAPMPDGLSEVLITTALSQRPAAQPDDISNRSALQKLAQCVCDRDARGLINSLVEITLQLCDAGSAGLSVLDEDKDGNMFFRWDALSGSLSGSVGGTTPRDWSPCGTTLDLNSPQLFHRPHRFFTYFSKAKPLIIEGLVLPLRMDDGSEFGTLWITSHDENRKFTWTEVETMTSLCDFTLAAVKILGIKANQLAAPTRVAAAS